MWKVVLAYASHRCLLLVVALFVINARLPSSRPASILPELHSVRLLLTEFRERIAEAWEFDKAQAHLEVPAGRIFGATSNPFFWLTRWTSGLTGLSTSVTILLLSNIFALLFLWELYVLLSQMTTTDVATTATILALIWPTSFEMSVGSLFGMSSWLVVLALRQGLSNQWLVAGIALGLLALVEPLAVGLLPLTLYFFWYFQRHFLPLQILKRACFLFLPVGLAIYVSWASYAQVGALISDSALLNIFSTLKEKGGLRWAISKSYAGQSLTIVFYAIGAVSGFLSNHTLIHRLIPINMLALLLLFSPYGAVASRAPLAAVCMEGIASASSRPVERIIQILLVGLGAYEVYFVFSV